MGKRKYEEKLGILPSWCTWPKITIFFTNGGVSPHGQPLTISVFLSWNLSLRRVCARWREENGREGREREIVREEDRGRRREVRKKRKKRGEGLLSTEKGGEKKGKKRKRKEKKEMKCDKVTCGTLWLVGRR
jgi:hypothetical protein